MDDGSRPTAYVAHGTDEDVAAGHGHPDDVASVAAGGARGSADIWGGLRRIGNELSTLAHSATHHRTGVTAPHATPVGMFTNGGIAAAAAPHSWCPVSASSSAATAAEAAAAAGAGVLGASGESMGPGALAAAQAADSSMSALWTEMARRLEASQRAIDGAWRGRLGEKQRQLSSVTAQLHAAQRMAAQWEATFRQRTPAQGSAL